MRVVPALALMACGGLMAACGPMALADAERVCMDSARDASAPRGKVGVGVAGGSGGVRPYTRLEVSVSSDYIMGRDPAQIFDACVQRRAGQPPSRPLYEQPGWGGR